MKGHTAIEYLMTYGWAILIILIVAGVLAYYGIFAPAGFLPQWVCTYYEYLPTTSCYVYIGRYPSNCDRIYNLSNDFMCCNFEKNCLVKELK